MKSIVNNLLHSILLPRGKKFVPDMSLQVGWEKERIVNNRRNVQVLYRTSPAATHTVILAHPYLADARQFYLKRGYTDMYSTLGCNVVLFDFNGFGESPFKDFNYEKDWAVVAAFCRLTFPDTQLTGHGISFGGSHTITYATHNVHGVDKFIIENTLDSNLSYYKKRNIRLYRLMKFLMRLSSKVNANHDYIQAASSMQHQGVLFIYNYSDDLTTISMGNAIMEKCPEPKLMAKFPGKHLEAITLNPDLYKNTIRNFIFDRSST